MILVMNRPSAESDNRDLPMVRQQRSPLQYSLRGLFLLTTCLAVLFALMGQIGGKWSAALVMLLVLIAVHMFGGAVGTHLRDHSTRAPSRPPRDEEI